MAEGTAERRLNPRLIAAAVVAGALIVFIVQNSARVRVEFLVFDRSTRVAWALLLAAALGFIAGFLGGRSSQRD